MRWPWQRRHERAAEHVDRALRDAEERLQRAHGESWEIDRRAAELPAGELYLRLSRVLRRGG